MIRAKENRAGRLRLMITLIDEQFLELGGFFCYKYLKLMHKTRKNFLFIEYIIYIYIYILYTIYIYVTFI